MNTVTRARFLEAGGAFILLGSRAACASASTFVVPELQGITVVRPGDAAYNAKRLDFNRRINKFPALIAYCRNASDVRRTVAYAHARELRTSVRSVSGHDFEGYSLADGGVVIDMSLMNGAQLQSDGSLLVMPGTPLGDFYKWSAQNAHSLPGGTCPSVGTGGLVSGGGFGFLSPWHGLFCDRLRRVQIVDAQANVRDSLDESDLLWAVQGGGGGNFGVVVALYFEPVALPSNAVTFSVSWPWDESRMSEVLTGYFAWLTSSGAPYYLTFNASAKSTGRFTLQGMGLSTSAAVRADVQTRLPLRGATVSVNAASFSDVVAFFGGERRNFRAKMKTNLGRDAPPQAAIDAIVAHLAHTPGPNDSIEIDTFGDAIGALAPDATAFPHRAMKYILLHKAQWMSTVDDPVHLAWIESLYDAVSPYFPHAAYRNFSDADLTDWQARYYAGNYSRLQTIKARLDPQNRFRYAQSIVPAL